MWKFGNYTQDVMHFHVSGLCMATSGCKWFISGFVSGLFYCVTSKKRY